MPSVFYKMEIAYKGLGFQGWQSQPAGNSVQDHIERALTKVLGHEIKVTGASRTDSGVHAEQQVASFQTSVDFELGKLQRSINALIPQEIRLLSINKQENDFHPIRSAKAKVYRYRLWLGPVVHPFVADFVWQIRVPMDTEWKADAFLDASRYFIGFHDFKSFAATDLSAKTTERRIYEVLIDDQWPLVDIYIVGQGFLKQMVRTMVGTLVDVGLQKRQPNDISKILEMKDRRAAGKTAPAHGLSLVKIFYDSVLSVSDVFSERESSFSFMIPDSLTAKNK